MFFTDRPKLLIGGAILFAVLYVVGSYFGSHWYYGDIEPVPEELLNIERYSPPPTSDEKSVPLSDFSTEERQSEAGQISEEKVNTKNLEIATDGSSVSVRREYFADGTPVPEHLRCPEKWVGVYLNEISDSELSEINVHIDELAREVVQNHNLNRPLSEVWPLYIEAEKNLIIQSEAVLSDLQSPVAAGRRIDRLYDQVRRFPEIQVLRFKEGRDGRWAHMYLVDIGHSDPDWNLFTLPDGRDFRVKYGRRYTFHAGKVTEGDKTGYGSFTICLSDPQTAENIVIENYEQVSDTELERLGGWNYNYNPYTGQ